jgi:HEAT repeat protein
MRFFKVNVEKMARKGDVTGLLGALDSEDPSIWIPAARALAAIGDERAISPLREKVEDWGPRMNGYRSGPGADALSALVAFNNERVARELISLFSDNWMDAARRPAVAALVSLGEPAARPVCEQLKTNKNPAFGSQRAMEVLKRIGSPSALPDVKDFVRAYIGGPELSARQIRAGYSDVHRPGLDNPTLLGSAIEYLADQEDPEVAGLLADLLTYLTGRFREGGSAISIMTMDCIRALRRMGATAAIPALEAVVTSPHAGGTERSWAVGALESVGAAVDWNAPWYLLAKQDWDKLVSLGEPALEQLVAALEDGGCKPAIDAIARIGGPRAVGVLTEASDSRDMTVRFDANNALKRLGQK